MWRTAAAGVAIHVESIMLHLVLFLALRRAAQQRACVRVCMGEMGERYAAASQPRLCCCQPQTKSAGGGSRCGSEGLGFIAADRRARDNGWGAGAHAIGAQKEQKETGNTGRQGDGGRGDEGKWRLIGGACARASVRFTPALASQQIDRHVLARGKHPVLVLFQLRVRVLVGGGKRKQHAIFLCHH